jgi:hypothetical protein
MKKLLILPLIYAYLINLILMNNNGIETSSNENLNFETGRQEENNPKELKLEENDIYIMELQNKLNEIKKERKQAENDANLLGNRLNLLKDEESKVHSFIKRHGKKWRSHDNIRH